jgi:hypothetical protein
MMRRLLSIASLVAASLLTALSPAGATSANLAVSPEDQTVQEGADFTVTIVQNSSVATAGGETDFSFDASLLQITGVELGSDYNGASLLMGVAPQTPAEAIAEANTTGVLKNVSAFFLPGLGSAPPGDVDLVVVSMQPLPGESGVSQLTLSNAEMIDDLGAALGVTVTGGQVTVGSPDPGERVNGDVDCNGAVNSVDALKVLRFVAQLSVAQGPDCPEIGSGTPLFADVDCSGGVNSVDSLKLLRHVASMPVVQPGGCAGIGSPLE